MKLEKKAHLVGLSVGAITSIAFILTGFGHVQAGRYVAGYLSYLVATQFMLAGMLSRLIYTIANADKK